MHRMQFDDVDVLPRRKDMPRKAPQLFLRQFDLFIEHARDPSFTPPKQRGAHLAVTAARDIGMDATPQIAIVPVMRQRCERTVIQAFERMLQFIGKFVFEIGNEDAVGIHKRKT
ncbi:hypothetical protein CEG88_26100 [Klebsiella aerogenes]|nr:hypothetical protein CEG88_26100 [Klebsiella aerogenes]